MSAGQHRDILGEPLRQSVVVTIDRLAPPALQPGQFREVVRHEGYLYLVITGDLLAFLPMEPAGLAPTGDIIFECHHHDVAAVTIDRAGLNLSATIQLRDGSAVVLAVGRSQLPRLRSLVQALHVRVDEAGRQSA